MRAIRILQHGAFTPEDVDRLQRAFEMAWTQIALSTPEHESPRAREVLATIIVAAGNISDLDTGELATVALRQFAAIRKTIHETPEK